MNSLKIGSCDSSKPLWQQKTEARGWAIHINRPVSSDIKVGSFVCSKVDFPATYIKAGDVFRITGQKNGFFAALGPFEREIGFRADEVAVVRAK